MSLYSARQTFHRASVSAAADQAVAIKQMADGLSTMCQALEAEIANIKRDLSDIRSRVNRLK